jgi:hypothetical protein
MTDKTLVTGNHFDLSKFKSVLNLLYQRLSAFHSSFYFDLIIWHYIFPATYFLYLLL